MGDPPSQCQQWQFWKQVYEDYQPENGDSLQLRSFIFDDHLHALDELHELEAPHAALTHHHGETSGTLGGTGVVQVQMGLPHMGAPVSV
jgi:phosphoglycolate phosphatase-like HAD superfamily hydrolase